MTRTSYWCFSALIRNALGFVNAKKSHYKYSCYSEKFMSQFLRKKLKFFSQTCRNFAGNKNKNKKGTIFALWNISQNFQVHCLKFAKANDFSSSFLFGPDQKGQTFPFLILRLLFWQRFWQFHNPKNSIFWIKLIVISLTLLLFCYF